MIDLLKVLLIKEFNLTLKEVEEISCEKVREIIKIIKKGKLND